jgi:DNA polymerase-4
MDVYKELSIKIRTIFERYTDRIEPLSLDEAYLDVTHCKQHKGSATLIAQEICDTIQSELNLTASAGVAPIKFLAKVASDINKPNGIYVIPPENIHSFIDDMPLNKIPGVGKVTFEKLKEQQLIYGKDIKARNEASLVSAFGKLGKKLWDRCHGIDEREIMTSRVRKSVGVERTFPTDIDDLSILKEILFEKILPELKSRAAKHLVTRSIQKIGVKVKFNDFQQTTKEFTFHHFDESLFSELLIEALGRGQGKKVRLLGAHINLSNSVSQAEQYSFSW